VGSEDEAEREAAAFAKPHTHTGAVSSRALFTLLHFSSCNSSVTHQFPFCEEISFFFFFFLPISLPFVLFISAQEEPAYSWIQISSCKTGDFSN
jgi:hypothetical protein